MSRFKFAAITLLLALLAISAAGAGTISIRWDPVPDADLAGYRIYYGTVTGNYDQSVDVGNVNSYTLSGLADCTTWYLAVKAYDTEGLESANFSAEISGWARPVVTQSAPDAGEQGGNYSLNISGSNFRDGATVNFAEPGITVHSVTVNSCTDLTADISISATATLGATDVSVINPDQVYGTAAGLFTVIEPVIPPTVTSQPQSQTVPESATATFSVTADGSAPLTYQWRRDGVDIAGANSPTYTTPPTTASDNGAVFRCLVSNAAGSDESNGAVLTVDVTVAPEVTSTAPSDGATGVARTVEPLVVFNVPMDPASIHSGTVQLLDSQGNPLAQTVSSPALAADGVTVTITPAQQLDYDTTYRIRVIGGASGVQSAEGEPMASNWTQATGFTTESNASPSTVENVERTDTWPAAQ